jgi:tetratricopeptide (TPR) repeat protein
MSQALLGSAVAEYEAGRFDQCVALCQSALARFPDEESFTTLLGMAAQAEGNLEVATAAFQRLTITRPDVPEYWSNLGLMLRQLRRFPEAEAVFMHSLALAPRAHDTLMNYGLLLLDMGRIADARHRFLDACELDGHSSEARIYAALACLDCGDTRRAEALIPAPAVWQSLDAALRRQLTTLLTQLGRVDEAEALLGDDALDPAAIARLAMLHERTNRIDSANALLDRIRHHMIEGDDPDLQIDAFTLDASLAMRQKDFPRARAATDRLLQFGSLPPQARANAYFTLARIADKEGRLDDAMAQLAVAHEIQFDLASGMAPEIAQSVEEPLRIASKWMRPDQCDFQSTPADAAIPAPVFIVGFPRSGTTMLEQMLDAHPSYASMDERIIIQQCVERMEAKGFEYPYQLDRLDEADLTELRSLYWAEADKVVKRSAGQVLVDKNPLNMLRLPMIRRLFPTARVILALRHPCDVILSCYMQTFRSPAFMVLCSTLERLSKTYVNAMRFWIHHQPLLCPDPLLLRYEETVTDFPAQVERIADYLGIEDRTPLATFAEHAARKGYISTPSYSQVIEPVNTRAIARWHPYRRYFEPVFPILQPIADHWGYRLED